MTWLFATAIVATLATFAIADAGPERHAGSVQSFVPSTGFMLVDEIGRSGAHTLITVEIRGAEVVRVWRDPDDPSRWKERPVRIHRLPVGTFVVVIGHRGPDDVVTAVRIEVPGAGSGAFPAR
jgi:hypothetical protein